ncbi:helix-turn-helix transcriptional regulator [Pandoraea apista]|uniref:Helix-turn-helix domain-containing protein n=1 Tax=Pandoraea apista TaxID=93218 RepID=A0ABX9ZW26_9BURK|nr:AraC family transcriptional regulator [Pandoraea apista]PTE02891.1 hypothetical protein C7830_01360 [Pandoraea apista]RRJ29892.1 helix-turn-helix domain-containing protein [Pandoraea apista]RRJ81217.1 helix-turn-helix domain-containing protein [Pandoraea apista]RSD18816.1 helix-turn-helix domain-containing protein [Pandoraea apista]RSD23111.1 helix-turn-helix domain-containing protein [Pandoraea apista]
MVDAQPWRHVVDIEGLSLVRGVVRPQAGESVREVLAGGDIKIVFLLDGALQWGAGGTPLLSAEGGSVNVCFGAAALDIDNVYGESDTLRYCSLRLSERYLQATCGLDAHSLTRRWREAVSGGARVKGNPGNPGNRGDWCESGAVLSRAMSAHEWQWATAMTSQTDDDGDASWQRLALVGQTFDALARCAAYIPDSATFPHARHAPGKARGQSAFSPAPKIAAESARERVTRRAVLAARDVLDERLQTPPSLPVLAREVGINVNKLCAGFRAQFGTTVHGYVRERRLATAFELLSARRISVSEAAWQCGYTDSHFAKVFRARFGMLPNTLARDGVSAR